MAVALWMYPWRFSSGGPLGMTQKDEAVLHCFYDGVGAQATLSPKRFPRIHPIVLAAGASSRMGEPKEFLEFQGLTCLEVVLRACAGAGLAPPIVVTRTDRSARLLALLAARNQPAVQVAVNPTPELGQTSSLREGLVLLPRSAEAFLIYPVDHPLVTATDVARLCTVFRKRNGPVTVVAPSFARRRGHPVVVDARVAPALLALGPHGSAREVMAAEAAATRFVELDDDRALTDMDTPDAYAACVRRYHRA